MSRLLVLLALLLACGPAQARPLDDVRKSGSITIFLYKDYQPYSWREGDEVKGLDADLARAIAERLGVTLDILMREADETVDDDLRVNVWRGDIIEKKAADLMLHVPFDRALETRAESLAILFNPYFQEEYAVIYDADRMKPVETYGSFVSRPIAVEVDTASDFFLSNAFRGQLRESVRRARYFGDVVKDLEGGEADAAMMTLAQAQWVKARHPDRRFAIAQPPTPGIVRSSWPIGMAVKQDSRDLGYAVGGIIEALVGDGTLAAIYARHGVEYRPARLAE